jgi:hypothetical protein
MPLNPSVTGTTRTRGKDSMGEKRPARAAKPAAAAKKAPAVSPKPSRKKSVAEKPTKGRITIATPAALESMKRFGDAATRLTERLLADPVERRRVLDSLLPPAHRPKR